VEAADCPDVFLERQPIAFQCFEASSPQEQHDGHHPAPEQSEAANPFESPTIAVIEQLKGGASGVPYHIK
jgi:hypothetical protein